MKLKLLPKFILSLGILGVALTVTITFFSYSNSKGYLEDMYALRVTTGSKSIASMLAVEDVRAIIAEGGDQSAAYSKVTGLFNTLKQDGLITYLSLVVPDEDSVTFYIDALVEAMGDDPANQIPYNSDILYTDAARDEKDLQNYELIWELYAQNRGTDSPVITDNSYGYNYTSVSPVLAENGKAIAEIQYILDMQQVRNHLNSFLYTMLLISLGIVLVTLLCYVLFVRRVVTTPIGQLAKFTKDITESKEFAGQKITIKTNDEIEDLGNSFNYMLEELEVHIENLSKITAEKERIGAELDVARNIQASMLPCIFPAFPERPELDIYATMTPAKEVGGDFYDFFLVDDDRLAMVMADVSGKGVPAALFMVIAKTLLKNVAQAGLTPKDVLEKVNNQLCVNNEAAMFVTVWLGVLEISTGKLICANAGHEYPVLKRAGGDYQLVKDKHGFVLAGMENSRYKGYELQMNPGDRLFLYTDGVTEATNARSELYGTGRMLAALNRNRDADCETLLHRMKEDIDAFVGEAPQFDDITMLSLELVPQNGPGMKKMKLTPALESIGQVTSFVEQELEAAGVSMKVIVQMNVAVDEIISNIARYSGATYATVGVAVENGLVTLRFADNGRPYDPTGRPDPDTTLPLEEREIGGLGIFIVKKSMDTVEYEYHHGLNILTLTKQG
ncbi:MAG: Phosphoserine phosphatase RsbU [Firmicutes bacterium ADurb.Bin456]|nr:MAG: Phosphoserine phosphatase RsbU [Firmicutes bacterium ADurb.Bin456]